MVFCYIIPNPGSHIEGGKSLLKVVKVLVHRLHSLLLPVLSSAMVARSGGCLIILITSNLKGQVIGQAQDHVPRIMVC